MKTRLWILSSFFAAALLWMLAGCGGGDSAATGGATSSTGTSSGATGAGGAGGAGTTGSTTSSEASTSSGTTSTTTTSSSTTSGAGGAGGAMPDVFEISPLDPILLVDNGVVPTQDFVATLNGQEVSGATTWIYDRPDIGVMGGATFTPTALVAGEGTLKATYAGHEATTKITVSIKKTIDPIGVTQAQIDAFANPTLGPDGMSMVYPFDGTVFPLGVLAPDVQWNGGAAGNVYRLHLKEKFYEYTAYFAAPPSPAHYLMAEADWKSVEDSGDGAQSDPLAMELQRMSNGQAYEPKTQTWHVAQGRLRGSVYYWELPDACGGGNGRILRIAPDAAQVDPFFSPGVCWGCHTVSRDGKTLAAEFNDGNGPLYTLDLAANPVGYGTIKPGFTAGNFIFSAFNEKGDKLLASDNTAFNPASAPLKIVDVVTRQTLNQNAMGSGCGEPAWSPDGAKIAAICNLGGGGWTFDATSGALKVADVAPDGFTVSGVTTIVPQAGAQGRPAYPSFSPGSEWIAYGRPTQGSRSTANGDLWIVAPDGSGVKQLATASSGNKSFNPVFAPLRAGGYFWIAYISRRDYGNQLVNANRQQIWVTAIDDPPGAADPSHPPFYMRGQEMCAKSENAYFALDPCKDVGEGCLSGVDCCNGQCVYDQNSDSFVCGQGGVCSQDGNACTISADCCNDPAVECIDGFCQPPPHL